MWILLLGFFLVLPVVCSASSDPVPAPPPAVNPSVFVQYAITNLGAIVGAVASFGVLAIMVFKGVRFLGDADEKEKLAADVESAKENKAQDKRISDWEGRRGYMKDNQADYAGNMRADDSNGAYKQD